MEGGVFGEVRNEVGAFRTDRKTHRDLHMDTNTRIRYIYIYTGGMHVRVPVHGYKSMSVVLIVHASDNYPLILQLNRGDTSLCDSNLSHNADYSLELDAFSFVDEKSIQKRIATVLGEQELGEQPVKQLSHELEVKHQVLQTQLGESYVVKAFRSAGWRWHVCKD